LEFKKLRKGKKKILKMIKICATELSFPVKNISLIFSKDEAPDIMRNGVKQDNSIEKF